MKKQILLTLGAAFALPSVLMLAALGQAAQEPKDVDLPAVFQAAGPDASSIQSVVVAFRAALGEPNNVNNPGPLPAGRREINWDGGGPPVDTTTPPVTPFNVFLDTRGGQFTTPGAGLSQAPPSGGPTGRSCRTLQQSDLRDNLHRLQSAALVHSGRQQHHGRFVLRARLQWASSRLQSVDSGRSLPTLTSRMESDPTKSAEILAEPAPGSSTSMTMDKLLFSSFVPASPGDGSLSFFGIVFEDARIARVRITDRQCRPRTG